MGVLDFLSTLLLLLHISHLTWHCTVYRPWSPSKVVTTHWTVSMVHLLCAYVHLEESQSMHIKQGRFPENLYQKDSFAYRMHLVFLKNP